MSPENLNLLGVVSENIIIIFFISFFKYLHILQRIFKNKLKLKNCSIKIIFNVLLTKFYKNIAIKYIKLFCKEDMYFKNCLLYLFIFFSYYNFILHFR